MLKHSQEHSFKGSIVYGHWLADLNDSHCYITGKVINIETQEHPFRQYGTWLRPDRCDWPLQNDLTSSHIKFIRVYYTLGSPTSLELGETCQCIAILNYKI